MHGWTNWITIARDMKAGEVLTLRLSGVSICAKVEPTREERHRKEIVNELRRE